MGYHRRNLPHYYPEGAILFVTWRLFGSLAPGYRKPKMLTADAGRSFVIHERLLENSPHGPFWLKEPRIADVVAGAITRGASERRLYDLYPWTVMPNHVHLVIQPWHPLPRITRWLKGSTSRAANQILERGGQPFWQYESYDHCVRTTQELNRIIRYVEMNPVKANLSESPETYCWSSASAGQRPALQNIR
jgi:REP element-mobilizing transposase RayT